MEDSDHHGGAPCGTVAGEQIAGLKRIADVIDLGRNALLDGLVVGILIGGAAHAQHHKVGGQALDQALGTHLGRERIVDVLGDNGRPRAVGIGHALGDVALDLDGVVAAEANDLGAVDKLAAGLFKVVDQVAAVGGAGAVHHILEHFNDGHVAAVLILQPVGGLHADAAAADDDDLLRVAELLGVVEQVDAVHGFGVLNAGDGRELVAALRADGEDDGVEALGLEEVVVNGFVQVDGHALGLLDLSDEPLGVVHHVKFDQRLGGGPELAAELVGLFVDLDLVTALGGDEGKVHTGAAAADDRDALDLFSLRELLGHDVLEAGARVDGALGMAALDELVDAALLTADARADVLDLAGIGLVAPVGISQHGTAEHDHVALAVAQRLFGEVGIAELADGDDGDLHADVGLHAARGKVFLGDLGDIEEAAGGHTGGRVRQPPVIVAAEVNVEHIDARLDEILHVIQRIGNGTAVLEVLEALDLLHALAVGLVQGEGEVDTVHDGEVGANALADLLDKVDAEALPVGILAGLAAVERGGGQLVEQITLVAVQIHAVHAHDLGVQRGLTGVADDLVALKVDQRAAGDLGQIEVGVDRGGDGELILVQQARRRADAAETRRELDEDAAAAGVNALSKIAPAHVVGARAVDAGEVGEVALLGDGRVDVMADGDEARGQKTDAALGAGEEVLEHLVVGTAGLLGHLAVAHRRHDKAVFHLELIDLNGGEELVVGIQLLRHARGAAGAVAGIGLEPVAVAVDQLLYQCVSFHMGSSSLPKK